MTVLNVKAENSVFISLEVDRSVWRKRLVRDLRKNWMAYLMLLPVIAYFIIFKYFPLYGVQIAFKDFKPAKGILASKWVGFKHFISFFNSVYFGRLMGNTLRISIFSLIFGFPAPIILALLLNEVVNQRFKKVVQTVTYIPHFISLVVMCGLIKIFSQGNGLFNDIIEFFGGNRKALLSDANLFTPIYIISGIWQSIGWGSIIYLAAITGIDPELYDAATIDGAGRLRQAWHVTISGIAPTIITLFILQVGKLMSVGYEKILLLYNDLVMEKADVISTYVYRRGLLEANYSFSAAVGLFNSVINFVLVLSANAISRKVTETSLW